MKRLLLFATSMAFMITMVSAKEPVEIKSISIVMTNGQSTGSATLGTIRGYVDEIVLACPSGTTVSGTNILRVTQTTGAVVLLATNTVTATTVIRPSLDRTDTAGSALSSDPPDKYLSWGDTFTYTVTNASLTGQTWTVWIKTIEP